MQQGHNYHRFGYQPFNEQQSQASGQSSQFAPQVRPGYGHAPSYGDVAPLADERGGLLIRRVGAMLTSPLAMTGVLIAAAVGFAGVFIMSSPSSSDIPQPIPIVQAESGSLKSAPDEAGGMDIANRDTTVFDAIKGEGAASRPVENLLEAASNEEEQPLSDAERAAALKTPATAGAAGDAAAKAVAPQEDAPKAETPQVESPKPETAKTATPPSLIADDAAKAEVAAEDIPEAPAEGLKAPAAATPVSTATPVDTAEASAKGIPLPRPQNLQKGPAAAPSVPMHEPGASPDTIAFVRDVLGKKDEKTASGAATSHYAPVTPEPGKQEIYGETVASVAPASGTESPAVSAPKASAGGSSYVQVVSVPSRAAAESEWGKLKKSLSSVLGSAPYRIQEANLGEKGTYYRVQLGPYAEADAKSLCSQIKAQKPGGCLVVH